MGTTDSAYQIWVVPRRYTHWGAWQLSRKGNSDERIPTKIDLKVVHVTQFDSLIFRVLENY
jgi:hypothetical protein